MSPSVAPLLAIDLGTQSVRALLFDLEGGLQEKTQVSLEAYYSDEPGWAEQDLEYFWDRLCEALTKLWDRVGPQKASIQGVAVTTQRATLCCVDAQGKPLRAAIHWLDQRAATAYPSIPWHWRAAFHLLGLRSTIESFQIRAPSNWLAQHQPELLKAAHKVLLLSGYINYRLTGRFADSCGAQVGYIPFDYKRQRWASKRDWKWQALSLDREQMPDLVQPGHILGEITPEAARETGLPSGLPVVAAAADKACEVLGSGATQPHIGCLSYGTTATINVTTKRHVEPMPFLPPYPAALPHQYAAEIQIYRGYWMVSWFKREFGLRERLMAEEQGVEPEILFDELVKKVPPGSLGLMLQPYWSPGVRKPGPEAKGAIIGFGDVHTRAHIYRAILEGLAYALREASEGLSRRVGHPLREVRVSGGGSQSREAMQLTADIFALPASRPHVYETSGLGAAIDLAVGLKLHSSFDQAVSAMTHVGETFEPKARSSVIYQELYHQVYRRMYSRLKPLYQRIREITGYPE